MNLFTSAGFECYTVSLPGTEIHTQWNSKVAKIGNKIYAILNEEAGLPSIAFKCSEEAFETLSSMPGAGQAPYFARRQWIKVEDGVALSSDELQAYLQRSYWAVAHGLSRASRAKLGL